MHTSKRSCSRQGTTLCLAVHHQVVRCKIAVQLIKQHNIRIFQAHIELIKLNQI